MKPQIILKKPSELIPYVNNARTHSETQINQIAASIKEFGFNNPILTDGKNGIIAGHGRLQAALKLGLESVPTIELSHLTDIQKKAYILADNRLAELSGWDNELLNIELEELKLADFDIELTGFDDLQIEENPIINGLIDDDDIPETPIKPKTKLGDVWILGNHRLMCANSAEASSIEMLLRGIEPDLLFTDPPYELNTQGGGILRSANSMQQIKENGVDKFDPLSLKLQAKTNIFFHNKPLIKKYIELAENNKQSYDLCFYKKNNVAPNFGGHMMTDIEYISIIGKQSPNIGYEKDMYSKCFIGDKDKDNELSYSKPVLLCEKYILLFSHKTVFDMFGGSEIGRA